ncbi:MAG TPA: efflux RND transporter periplasmic adaptor subunit [Steroidobacteraceae bacterium]|nr:efflux RND transporter periplasmic adaptor subunit [Steroidobacteraceae bacterium]
MHFSRFAKRRAGSALLAAVAASLAACGSSGPGGSQAASAPPPVTVVALEPQQVPLTSDFTGRLSAYREANVLARVSGVLLKRFYKEGTEVKAGQALFQIDPAPYKAALDAALAALAQARANAVNGHTTAQRDRDLISSHLVSEQQLDTDEATERSTAAAVKQADANVESARINLGYTNVTSPIEGIAGEQQVTEGALVGQGTPTLLTTVDQLNPIYVNFDEPATQIEQLTSEQQSGHVTAATGSEAKVQLTLPDGTPYGVPGVLDFHAATVDPSTGTAALRGILPNPDHALLPGMYVNLRLTVGYAQHAFLVPQAALQRDAQGAYVFTVGTDDTVAQKRITTEGTTGVDWIVTSGLTAGDRVIVAGIQSAHPGAKVAAVEESTASARPRAANTGMTSTTGLRRLAAADAAH